MLNKNIPRHVIEFLSSTRSQKMYIDLPAIETLILAEASDAVNDNPAPKLQKRKIKISQELEIIARTINTPPQCFMSQGEIYDFCKIKGGAKKDSIKKEALKKQLLRIHQLQVGRTRRNYWENTPKIRELLNLPKPNIPSKGGYAHQLTAFYVSRWAFQNGYRCKLEVQIGSNNKAVDALLTNDEETIVMEFCMSEPIAKELTNIEKDITSGFKFTKLIFLARDSNMRKKLEKIIDGDLFASSFRKKIEVKLAGDYMKDE